MNLFCFADQGCYDAIKIKLLKLSSVTPTDVNDRSTSSVTSTDVNDRSTLNSTSIGGYISTTNRTTTENSR